MDKEEGVGEQQKNLDLGHFLLLDNVFKQDF